MIITTIEVDAQMLQVYAVESTYVTRVHNRIETVQHQPSDYIMDDLNNPSLVSDTSSHGHKKTSQTTSCLIKSSAWASSVLER